jgi:hypothetical protein
MKRSKPRQAKTGKTCTTGRCGTPRSVRIKTLADARKWRSQQAKKAAKAIRLDPWQYQSKTTVILSIADAAGNVFVPSRTHRCAPLFITYMQKLAESDAAGELYLDCIEGQTEV